MGVYDVLYLPNTPADGAQVKFWDCMLRNIEVGDKVPALGVSAFVKLRTYAVVLREGGALLVDKCRVTGWVETLPSDRPLVDKWGNTWVSSEHNCGILGEPYFYAENAVA